MLRTSLMWRSTVAFTYLQVKSAKCLCLLPVVFVLVLVVTRLARCRPIFVRPWRARDVPSNVYIYVLCSVYGSKTEFTLYILFLFTELYIGFRQLWVGLTCQSLRGCFSRLTLLPRELSTNFGLKNLVLFCLHHWSCEQILGHPCLPCPGIVPCSIGNDFKSFDLKSN